MGDEYVFGVHKQICVSLSLTYIQQHNLVFRMLTHESPGVENKIGMEFHRLGGSALLFWVHFIKVNGRSLDG